MYIGSALFAVISYFAEELIVAVIILGVGPISHLLIFMLRNRRKRLMKLHLTQGEVKQATVINNLTNRSHQVNDSPQRIIMMNIDGKKVKYKTNDHELANEFYGEIDVLYRLKFKRIIPISYFIKYEL